MKKTAKRSAPAPSIKNRLQQAEARTVQAEARTESAKARTESAETRTEQAETRTEQAKTRTEQAEVRAEKAETRTEQAEAALERSVPAARNFRSGFASRTPPQLSAAAGTARIHPLEQLTIRQREILQLIAEGQNTKQIAEILKVSPKTVEYHRMKLMAGLNLHDIPGLVRYAMRVGLIPPES